MMNAIKNDKWQFWLCWLKYIRPTTEREIRVQINPSLEHDVELWAIDESCTVEELLSRIVKQSLLRGGRIQICEKQNNRKHKYIKHV